MLYITTFVLYLALCYAVYNYFCVVSCPMLCCILLLLCCILPYAVLYITTFVLYLALCCVVYYYFCVFQALCYVVHVYHYFCVVSCPLLCCILLLLCCILPLCCVVYYYFCVVGIVHKILWVPDKPPVNKAHCRCDCFDTVFKGSYWITLLCFPWIVSQE